MCDGNAEDRTICSCHRTRTNMRDVPTPDVIMQVELVYEALEDKQ